MKMHFISIMGIVLISISTLGGCKKSTEIIDDRDIIVGNYKALDSIFEVASIDTTGGVVKVNFKLKKILFHPLVTVSKGTFFTYDKTWVQGVKVNVIEEDNLSGDYAERMRIHNKAFKTTSHSGTLFLDDLDSPSERTATIHNRDISVVYKTFFSREYSRSYLTRLP